MGSPLKLLFCLFAVQNLVAILILPEDFICAVAAPAHQGYLTWNSALEH